MKNNRIGFTLLEVLLVVSIVGLLSSAVFINFSLQIKKSHDAKRKTDVHELQVALETYYTDQGYYPPGLPPAGQPLTSPDGQTVYLSRIQKDPMEKDPLLYVYNATPSSMPISYDICAFKLESIPDDRTPGKDESFCLTNRQ